MLLFLILLYRDRGSIDKGSCIEIFPTDTSSTLIVHSIQLPLVARISRTPSGRTNSARYRARRSLSSQWWNFLCWEFPSGRELPSFKIGCDHRTQIKNMNDHYIDEGNTRSALDHPKLEHTHVHRERERPRANRAQPTNPGSLSLPTIREGGLPTNTSSLPGPVVPLAWTSTQRWEVWVRVKASSPPKLVGMGANNSPVFRQVLSLFRAEKHPKQAVRTTKKHYRRSISDHIARNHIADR